ncbi:hypothetical protein BJ741DRAFT_581177 [Chytriomyces cf. hyalinus JEL632]|nr:hypothetical protein BJ741DRAFT_581177 [Chytriomyces cf. hyalinus JEL632]
MAGLEEWGGWRGSGRAREIEEQTMQRKQAGKEWADEKTRLCRRRQCWSRSWMSGSWVHRQRKNRPITAAKEIGAESAKLSAEIGVGRDRHRFGNDDRLICLHRSSADELEKNGRFIGRKAVLEIKVTKRGLEPAYHAVDARVPTTILHAQ